MFTTTQCFRSYLSQRRSTLSVHACTPGLAHRGGYLERFYPSSLMGEQLYLFIAMSNVMSTSSRASTQIVMRVL